MADPGGSAQGFLSAGSGLILVSASRPFFLAALRELRLDSAAAVSGRGSQGPVGTGGQKLLALGRISWRIGEVWSSSGIGQLQRRLSADAFSRADTQSPRTRHRSAPRNHTNPWRSSCPDSSQLCRRLPTGRSTVEEAAAVLGISRTLAYSLANEFLTTRSGLPCVRLGSRRIVVPRAALERWTNADLANPNDAA